VPAGALGGRLGQVGGEGFERALIIEKIAPTGGCQYAGGFIGGSSIGYTLMTLHSPSSKTFVNHVSRCSACSGRERRRSRPADKSFTVGA